MQARCDPPCRACKTTSRVALKSTDAHLEGRNHLEAGQHSSSATRRGRHQHLQPPGLHSMRTGLSTFWLICLVLSGRARTPLSCCNSGFPQAEMVAGIAM